MSKYAIESVCEYVETYSAESAGRMDIGERWELQSQREEKHNKVRTSRTPRLLSRTDLGGGGCRAARVKTEKKNVSNAVNNEYVCVFYTCISETEQGSSTEVVEVKSMKNM